MVSRLGIEQSGLSKHLSILKQAGILSSRQEKATVFYSVHDRDIFLVLRTISEMLMKKFVAGGTILVDFDPSGEGKIVFAARDQKVQAS